MLYLQKLTRKLSAARVAEIHEWWRSLESRERLELGRDAGRPPKRIVARFVEPGDDMEATDGLYEYLVNHEIYIDDGPKYHICSAHPEARAVLDSGRIPQGFRCPRGEKACPMRVLLDLCPGHDVRLTLGRR